MCMFLDFSIVSASLAVANFELSQVLRAHRLFDKSIEREIEAFQTEIRQTASTVRGAMADMRIDDEYGELVDLSRINNYSAVALAYATLERFFMDVFNSARLEIFDVVGKDEESLTLKRYVVELRKLNIDLEHETFESMELRRFNRIRNAIMHHGGHSLGKWNGDQYNPGEQIPVSRDDVENFIALAGRTCQLIADKYEALARAAANASTAIQ